MSKNGILKIQLFFNERYPLNFTSATVKLMCYSWSGIISWYGSYTIDTEAIVVDFTVVAVVKV